LLAVEVSPAIFARHYAMNAQEIETLIRGGFPEAETVRVIDEAGDGHHFAALVVTPAFQGKMPVERHQMVYASLQGAMADRIHALAIKTYTPQEWQRVAR